MVNETFCYYCYSYTLASSTIINWVKLKIPNVWYIQYLTNLHWINIIYFNFTVNFCFFSQIYFWFVYSCAGTRWLNVYVFRILKLGEVGKKKFPSLEISLEQDRERTVAGTVLYRPLDFVQFFVFMFSVKIID